MIVLSVQMYVIWPTKGFKHTWDHPVEPDEQGGDAALAQEGHVKGGEDCAGTVRDEPL